MKRRHILALAAVTASLLVACGGSHAGSGSGTAPALAATTGSATSYGNVKWGGGGYVTGLIYHPVTPNIEYARTDVGGAYRWNNLNGAWTPITDGIGFNAGESTYHGVESIALDPNNDKLVYMTTGMYSHDYQGTPINGRIYVSGDRGTTWAHYDLPFPVGGNENARAIGERLKVDPTNPTTLFYASRTAGLWKSIDSGKNWTQQLGLSSKVLSASEIQSLGADPVGVEQIMFDNSSVGGSTPTWNMYAAIAPDYAAKAGLTSTLYKSSNNGGSWTPVTVPSAVAGYYVPHMVRASDGAYYVVFNKNAGQGAQGPGYLYKFGGVAFGETWTLLASSTQGGYGGVSVFGSGSTARIALAVTGTWGANNQVVQLSDNGGGTWREIAGGTQHWGAEFWGWVDDIEIDPFNKDHIMYVYGGGIWETWNASAAAPAWDTPVNNVEETATLSLATPPAGAAYKLVTSMGDIGTWVQTDLTVKPTRTPSATWSNGNSADILWSNPSYIVGSGIMNDTRTHNVGFWSADGGNTWSFFPSVPAAADTDNGRETSIVITSPGHFVWAPPNLVPYITTDSGATWTQVINLPAPTHGLDNGYHLVVDRQNPNKVYAYDGGGGSWTGTPGKVWISTDAGLHWQQTATTTAFAPNIFDVTSIKVNPNVQGDLWLVDGNAVYHSTNSGANWSKVGNFGTVAANGSTAQLQGASAIALGKPLTSTGYSAAVYVVGTVTDPVTKISTWGIYHSDDGGATWARFNDDAHQYGGVGSIAGDWNTYGRIYFGGTARGVIYTN